MKTVSHANQCAVYRLPSKRPIAIAFAAAIMIHLCAVALASRRASLSAEPLVTNDVGVVELEEPDIPPIPPESEMIPAPPLSFVPNDFVEPDRQPLHLANHNPKPIGPIAKSRFGGISNGRALALNAPRPEYP